MIARIWRGWTAPEEGNRGLSILHRRDGDREEFLTISLWDSLESIRAFAGDDIQRAVFYPEDDRYLVERELTVSHFEYVPTGTDPAPGA
jgi:heme-degrading monooxygenase HmoA